MLTAASALDSEPFLEKLAELCRAHPIRLKWIFIPSHTLGERLALDRTNWLNLRFVPPLDMALRRGAPFLVERGIEPSEEGLGPGLAMRLMLELPDGTGYFRPLADQPTMAAALWATHPRASDVRSGNGVIRPGRTSREPSKARTADVTPGGVRSEI
jgi:hypothetical protein